MNDREPKRISSRVRDRSDDPLAHPASDRRARLDVNLEGRSLSRRPPSEERLSHHEGKPSILMQTLLAPPAISRPSVRATHTLPIYLRSAVGPSIAYLTTKRTLDILASSLLLALLLPFFIVVAALVKLTDGGPIFFRQRRVGINGKEFFFYKIRSMVVNAEALKQELLRLNKHQNSITFKMQRDPRITWIGRILRKTSIDELPQLWNVLKGEMTLVGPRPAVVSETQKYNAHERRRLQVTPGLTCYWQVSGRADLDFAQQVDLDLKYIRERSLWVDMRIMLLTIPAVLSGKGAY